MWGRATGPSFLESSGCITNKIIIMIMIIAMIIVMIIIMIIIIVMTIVK